MRWGALDWRQEGLLSWVPREPKRKFRDTRQNSSYKCRQMSKSIHESVPKWADICLRLLLCCVVGK